MKHEKQARELKQKENAIVASFAIFATRGVLASTVVKLCNHFITLQDSNQLHVTIVSAIVTVSHFSKDSTTRGVRMC